MVARALADFADYLDRRKPGIGAAADLESMGRAYQAYAAERPLQYLTQSSFWGALAYVLIGGVGAGTILTLLFLPALYAVWFKVERRGRVPTEVAGGAFPNALQGTR